MASKRSRSALSPSPNHRQISLPEFPAAMWATEHPIVGPPQKLKLSQNPTLEPDIVRVVQPPWSIMSLGLPTSECAKTRSSPQRFVEFLQACRWCRRKIGEDANVYMYGYLGAFCSPECREHKIRLDSFQEEHYSKSGEVDKGTDGIKKR